MPSDIAQRPYADLVWQDNATAGARTPIRLEVRSVGDVDRDGQHDLLWQNIVDGHVATWTFSMLVARGGYVIAPNWADPTWKMIR